jgi:hypothetical protein
LALRRTQNRSTQKIPRHLCFIYPMAPTGNDFLAPLLREVISDYFDCGMGQPAERISVEVAEIWVSYHKLTSVIGKRVALIEL